MFEFMKKKAESEKDIERRLVDSVKALGGEAIKLTSQYHRGLPDRLVVMPYRTTAFIELKSTGKKPTKLQEIEQQRLKNLGFKVYTVDNIEDLNKVLATLTSRVERCKQREKEQWEQQLANLKNQYPSSK